MLVPCTQVQLLQLVPLDRDATAHFVLCLVGALHSKSMVHLSGLSRSKLSWGCVGSHCIVCFAPHQAGCCTNFSVHPRRVSWDNGLDLGNHNRMHTFSFQKADDIGWWFFFAPWTQAIPFFMGTFLGQLLLDGKVRPLSIGWSRTLSWLAGVIVLLVPINTYYDSQSMESVTKGNDFSETIPLIIACILFCLSIFWFLYQSLASPSNWLTKFFGAKIFQPFSRISFSLYMCHWYPIWYNVANVRNPINLANMHELMKIITMNFVHTFLLALLLHVTFEAPSVRLLKLFFLKPPPATLVHKMTGEVNKQPKHGATTESFLHVDQVRRRGVPGK